MSCGVDPTFGFGMTLLSLKLAKLLAFPVEFNGKRMLSPTVD